MNVNIKAALLVIFGMVLISSNDAIIKVLSGHMTVPQILSVRGLFAVVIFSCLIKLSGRPLYQKGSFGLWNWLRSLCEVCATLCFVTGLALLPIATASTLVWTSPILVTICAALILKERVTFGRWIAVLVGFIGVLCVTNPWDEAFSWSMGFPIAAAFFVCVREMVTKRIDPKTRSVHVTLATLLSVTVVGTLLSLNDLPTLSTSDVSWLLLSAACLSVGFLSQITAIRMGELSFVAPFAFTGILVAVFYGYFIWSDKLTVTIVFGIALIVSAGLYLMTRQKDLKSKPVVETSA